MRCAGSPATNPCDGGVVLLHAVPERDQALARAVDVALVKEEFAAGVPQFPVVLERVPHPLVGEVEAPYLERRDALDGPVTGVLEVTERAFLATVSAA